MRLIDADAFIKKMEGKDYGWIFNYDDVLDAIDELSTVEQSRWILCSERLPDDGDIVIVSIRDETGDTKFNYSSYGWITTNKEYWIVDNEINNYVVAWMSLPEPYEPYVEEK